MPPSPPRQRRLRLGDVVFDPGTLELWDAQNHPIAIRKMSLRVLGELAARNGETITRDDLIDSVWAGRAVSDDSLVQCIKDIRSALNDQDHTLVRTAVGRGYSLQGVLEPETGPGQHPKLLISALHAPENNPDLVELANLITEELVVTLSPRAGLNVTTDETQRDAAQYRIEGRVSLSGNHIRAFVQVIDTATEKVAFAETWNAQASDAKGLTNRVAEKVSSVLRIHMFNHAGQDHIDRNDEDLDMQELMSKAAYHMSRIRMENRDVARRTLSVAIEREPENPMALAMRAAIAVILVLQEGISKVPDPTEYCLDLADRAVGLAPHVDFVMLTRGSARLWLRADHDGARADFKRALAFNPVFHLGHQFLATSEILSGEYKPGIERLQKIIDLGTATNPRYPHYLTLMALGHLVGADIGAAEHAAREAHERAPNDPWCNYVYTAALADQEMVTTSEPFREMVSRIELPFSHFRSLPFTEVQTVDMLEARLRQAGYPQL